MKLRKDADQASRADDDDVAGGRRRVAVRVLGSAAASTVLAVGFLASSVASVPWNEFPSHRHDAGPSVAEPVSVGRIGSTGTTAADGPQTVAQVLEILERAERTAVAADHPRTPEIDQAAAELGMLLSVYTAQQHALSDPRPGLRAPGDRAVPRGVGVGDAVPVSDATVVADVVAVRDGARDDGPAPNRPSRDDLVGDDGDLRPPAVATPPAEAEQPAETEEPAESDPPAESEPDGTTTPEDTEPPADVAPPAEIDPHDARHEGEDAATAHEHGDETVTFDDVVVAATRLASLLDPASASYVANILPADGLSPNGAEAVRAELTESLLEAVERYAGTIDGYQNGRIPASVLCPLDFAPGHLLRCDAAEQLTLLSEAYEAEFGVPIPITDSYRSYAAQVAVRAAKPHLAAVPGTSNHGWGLAVDLSYPISSGRSAEYVWLRVHGPDYGWDNPGWARPNGSKPEPWHFEFFAGGPIPDRAWSSSDVRTGGSAAPRDGADKDGTRDGDPTPSASPSTPKPEPVQPEPVQPKPTPTPEPSTKPSPKPSPSTSPKPSPSPSPSVTPTPTDEPTEEPTQEPTEQPTPEPTDQPTEPAPADEQSGQDSDQQAGDGETEEASADAARTEESELAATDDGGDEGEE